jgi:hypothetical protein
MGELAAVNSSTEGVSMKTQNLLIVMAMLVSPTCFASPINTVASDDYVQDMVSRLASQSMSGDPVYCSFDKPKEIELKETNNDLEYQVEIDCGSGTQRNHTNDRKVFVKGFIEDSMVFVTGLQMNSRLP